MKRKSLLFLLLLALMAPWAANAQETLTVYDGTTKNDYVPAYMYYFDDFTRSQFVIPAGDLEDLGDGAVISEIAFYADQAYPGSGKTPAPVVVYLKEVNYTSISAFETTASCTTVYTGTLATGTDNVMTITFATPYTYNNGNLLIGLENTEDKSWQHVYFFGQSVNGASVAGSNGSSLSSVSPTQRNFIPKTTFTYEPAASDYPKPANLQVGTVTDQSATLTWEAPETTNTISGYSYNYKKHSATIWSAEGSTLSSVTEVTLNNLDAETDYDFRVKAWYNNNANESSYATTTFRTGCGVITIGETAWTEDFENFYHVTLAPGWNDSKAYMMNDGCWDIDHGEIVNPALYTNYKPAAFSGTVSVQFTNAKGSATLILPEFTNALNTLQLEFKANVYQSANEGTMEVGYWYNGQFTAIHTGIQTQTARGANDNTNASGDYMGPYALTGNIPSGSRIAFHYNVSTTSGCINVDDFRVSLIPSCPKPANLAANNITDNAATFSWTENGDATAWVLEYGTASDFTGATQVNVSGTPTADLTGLNANTTYYVRVKAVCDESDESDWSGTESFTTACGVITSFPVTYGFETTEGFPSNATYPTTNQLGDCWRNEATVQNGTNATRVWGTSTSYKHGGSQALVLPDKGNSTNFAKTMLVFPAMDFTSANGYTVSFWIYRSGSSSNPEGFKVYASDTDTISANAVELGHYSRNYSIAYPVIESGTGWYKYETPVITMTGTVYIIFEGQSYYGSATYVDDIVIKEVVNVTADQIVNTVSDPATQMTWNEFATHWNNGDHFTHTTFTLMDDITVTTMVGTSDTPFTGTFDGNGHTININYNEESTTNTEVAPFRYVNGATIQNLVVDGTITTAHAYCAGLVGNCIGANTITNCVSNVTINSSKEGDGTHGGFAARVADKTGASITFNGCVFTGKLLGENTYNCGGFVGWNYKTATFNNCLFAPTQITVINNSGQSNPNATFTRAYASNSIPNSSGVTINNCYYTETLGGTIQGKAPYTITGVGAVTVAMSGTPTSYSVSGIAAYTAGIIYNSNIYAGEGDNVALTLSGAPGYEANHGTLTANGDNFILTMEAYDTEISGIDCPVPYNVAATDVDARSAQITWTGNSDSYTLQYREVITESVDFDETYDFEDNTLQGWTTISNDNDNIAWNVQYSSSSAHEGSYSVRARYTSSSDGGDANDWLISPQIPLGGTFSFYARRYSTGYTDRFQVYVSTTGNNISDFTAISEVITPNATYDLYEYDLSSYSGNGYVAIVYTAPNNQYYVYVDDINYTNHVAGEYGEWQTVNDAVSPQPISLTPETTYQVQVKGTCAGVETDYSDVMEFTTPATCPAPTALAVTEGSVTAHAATITWTENGEATTWIVEYADNADFTGALTETVEDEATYSFDGLEGETSYYVRVKAHCGEEDESDYSNVVNFTTLVACQAPTVLTVTEGSITTTQVELSWTENGTATAWQICLNDDETNLIPADSNPFILTGLTASTAYTVKVRANCGGIDGESDWSNTVNFATECEAITITAATPYTQDFETPVVTTTYSQIGEMPACWENYPVNNAASAKILAEDVTYNYADEGQVLYFYGEGNNYAVLPEFTNALNTLQISFKYATESSSNGTLTLGFISNGDEGFNTFEPVSQFTIFNASSDSDDTFVDVDPISLQSLPANATRLVFRWYYSSQWGCNVDDVVVSLRTIPSFTKTIEAVGEENWEGGRGGYYLIASPLDASVSPAEVGMITDEEGSDEFTYDLYSFNQAEDLEWQNYRAFNFNIVGGQGYLYASKYGTTLTFTGDPAISDASSVQLFKTDNTNVDFQGWNLVGNPFTEDAYIEKPFYTLENSDTYTANEAGTAIHAMQGLFVVADEDGEMLTFTTEAPSKNAKLNMNLRSDNKQLDNAILVFGGNQQLGKMTFRENSSKIYMPVEGKEYAVATAEGNVGTMPVSFKAESNGTYTLSFTSEEVSFAYLHLIDNMTGIETDLLATPSYSFEARTTDYESRFKLVFATGNNANDDAFAFYSNGSFVINNEGNATLQVIDVNGRILKSESINGCANVNVKAAQGVYMLRLVNGENVKVQKVVVR